MNLFAMFANMILYVCSFERNQILADMDENSD